MALVSLNKRLDRIDRYNPRRAKPKGGKFFARLLIFLVILVVVLYLPSRGIYSNAKGLSASSKLLSAGFKNNNLDQVRSSVKQMKGQSEGLDRSLTFLFWLRVVPIVSGYYIDAKHFSGALVSEMDALEVITDGLDPFKSELGFTNTPTPGQDKVSQFVKILDKSLPNLDKVKPQLVSAGNEVTSIDTGKYPEKIGSRRVKTLVETAKNFIIGGKLAVTDNRDLLALAPQLLGEPSSKTYLILFQNDKEIRATGGFLTAYAFLKLDHGHVSSTTSDDIYRLDERLLNVCQNKICPLTPPAPIAKYLPEANGKPRTAWSMRDSNISPDLPTSMKQFESMYSLLGEGTPWDGIITIDSQVVESMVEITGPVDVFGTKYSAEFDKRCNCPNVIYELENYSEVVAKGQSDRKAVLGALMQQILGKALSSSTEKLPEFASVGANLAEGKHMMFYLHDSQAEQALAKLNWTGHIFQTKSDYLNINNSNFAGGKSNLYVSEDVTLEIDKKSGVHKLTINFNNPQPYNSWLNAINRDYVRVYAPKGSNLTFSKGSDEAVHTIDEELGKTVFEAFVQIRPQNSRSLVLQYTTPTIDGDPYPILIQKQPGTKDFRYTVRVGNSSKTFNLSSDQNLGI